MFRGIHGGSQIRFFGFFPLSDKYEAILYQEKIKKSADQDLIDNLESKDAYHLGYLAGQEQTFRDFACLKLLSSKKDEMNFQSDN